MKRAFSVLSCAAVLIALLPATASAARPTKYTEHSVFVYCEEPVDGGYAIVTIGTSNINGDGASADVWLDPAVPFEDPTSMTGVGSTVERTQSPTQVVLTSSFPVTDWRDYDSVYTERYMGLPQDNPEGYDSTSVVKEAGMTNMSLSSASVDRG